MGGNGPPQYPSRQTGLLDGLKGSRGDREEWTSTFYMKLSGRNVGHVWNARMSGRNDRESRNRALYLTRSIFSNSCFLILLFYFLMIFSSSISYSSCCLILACYQFSSQQTTCSFRQSPLLQSFPFIKR